MTDKLTELELNVLRAVNDFYEEVQRQLLVTINELTQENQLLKSSIESYRDGQDITERYTRDLKQTLSDATEKLENLSSLENQVAELQTELNVTHTELREMKNEKKNFRYLPECIRDFTDTSNVVIEFYDILANKSYNNDKNSFIFDITTRYKISTKTEIGPLST